MRVVKVISNRELSEDDLNVIIKLKQQYWKYNQLDQMQWIEMNLKEDDSHFMLFENNVLVSYLNLVKTSFTVNGQIKFGYGIGNVCVDKKCLHKGYAKFLINNAVESMSIGLEIGFLFCRDELIEFYEKLGWKNITDKFNCILIDCDVRNTNIMSIHWNSDQGEEIAFDRNF